MSRGDILQGWFLTVSTHGSQSGQTVGALLRSASKGTDKFGSIPAIGPSQPDYPSKSGVG